MKIEIKNRQIILFLAQSTVVVVAILLYLVGINYSIDASDVITSKQYKQMAQIVCSGNTVAVPENYNERVFQIAVIDEMKNIPETVVIGSSRGMFLGEEITGDKSIYNHCVSGACMEDYYAILGLYDKKFSMFPSRIIIETSPWVFFGDNPESRWAENYSYRTSSENLYRIINGYDLDSHIQKENPYFSIPYFQYNLSVLSKKGVYAFIGEPARVSVNDAEAADYPDGTIRYISSLEIPNQERLKKVTSDVGAVTYLNVNDMMILDTMKVQAYENLIDYLLEYHVEIIIYMQPFSVTKCHYIYDENTNPVFSDVENYLHGLGQKKGITVIGGFDSRQYDLSDDLFIDFMHLDKTGTKIIWNDN